MRLIHRCQQGFTTVTLMGVLMVGGLLMAASFAAVDPDIGLTQKDDDSKQAYGAAESGINYYLNKLGQDNNYYVKCTNVTPPAGPGTSPVNQAWNGTTPAVDPRVFRPVPGYPNVQYTIELLPATGYTSCLETAQESMIDPATGSFRIRATGKAGSKKRSIVATMRRKTFIDYIYFTDFETLDPFAYPDATDQAYAAANCAKYRAARPGPCTDISFIDADNVRGPFHSNDSILVCGNPTFGRNSSDIVEINDASPGWFTSCGGASPDFQGTPRYPGGNLPMPPTNAALADAAAAGGITYTGETTIVLKGSTMDVTTSSGTTTGVALPANGVIYVKNGTCSVGYSRQQDYAAAPGCGNVYVSGTYNSDLTIGADNDIIIKDDLKRGSTGVLGGLIANNFVRVYHPVNNRNSSGSDCDNNGGPGSITIEAAILALNHSFIVDNWYCGNPTGTLTVTGAIAQKFRGTVGTFSGGSVNTGYIKDYNYNDRLRYREPPYFLDPVQSAWQIIRQNEQVPPR